MHWRGGDHTKTCLTSLRSLSYPNFKTLLVDNGAPEKDGEAIARQFPEAALLKLPENLGFAGGANAGINYCLAEGAKWIWLLNNDTKVDIDSLSLLMECAKKHSDAGVIGAMVHTGSGETYAASGRRNRLPRGKTY